MFNLKLTKELSHNFENKIQLLMIDFTSGGSTSLSTASEKMKNEMNRRKRPLMKPANTSARTYLE